MLEIYYPAYMDGFNIFTMRDNIKRPALRKLFTNRFYTYVVADSNGRGAIVEVKLKVNGRRISYSYTNIKERG